MLIAAQVLQNQHLVLPKLYISDLNLCKVLESVWHHLFLSLFQSLLFGLFPSSWPFPDPSPWHTLAFSKGFTLAFSKALTLAFSKAFPFAFSKAFHFWCVYWFLCLTFRNSCRSIWIMCCSSKMATKQAWKNKRKTKKHRRKQTKSKKEFLTNCLQVMNFPFWFYL